MAVAPVAYASANSAAGSPSSLVINVPTGTVNGNLMIANLILNSASTTTMTASGWSVVPLFTVQAQGTACCQTLLYRIASSEPASYTFSVSPTATFHIAGTIATYSGVDVNNPFANLKEGTFAAATSFSVGAVNFFAESAYGVFLAGTRNTVGANTIAGPTFGGFGYTTSVSTSSTASAFIQSSISDGHILYSPVQSSTAGSYTSTNSSTSVYAILGLRADISAATSIIPDYVGSNGVLNSATQTSALITTGYTNELITVSLVSNTIPVVNSITDNSGLGLSWTLIQTVTSTGSISVYYAFLTSKINNVTVTITLALSARCDVLAQTFKNTNTSTPIGASSTTTGTSATAAIAITTTAANSFVDSSLIFIANAGDNMTPASGNTFVAYTDVGTSGARYTRTTSPVVSSGTSTTVGGTDTGGSFAWAIVGYEILAFVAPTITASGATLAMMGVG